MDKQLKAALQELTSKDVDLPATVREVDKQAAVVVVQDHDGFVFNQVRLTSVIDDTNKVVQYPAVESPVLVSR